MFTTATKNKGGNRNMKSPNTVLRWVAMPMLLGCLGTASAWAQDQPNQTLDQVDAFSAFKVLEMAFDRQDPPTLPDFSEPDLGSPAGIAACKLASSGLYCLATNGSGSQVVRQWALPLAVTNGTPPVDRFSCADSALGLNGGPCTGMTVDVSGAIWVSGKKTGTTNYRLIKLVKPAALPTGCTAGGSIDRLTSRRTKRSDIGKSATSIARVPPLVQNTTIRQGFPARVGTQETNAGRLGDRREIPH